MYYNLNLNFLKYFYEVVRIGNITKASNILMISQPAITRAIKELENQLGVELLQRSKKGVEVTVEGEILYKNIGEIYKIINSTLDTIESVKNDGGYLYIGATTTNFMPLLESALKTFKKKYPNIHIDIVLEEIKVLEERKKLGKLDIIIKNSYELIEGFVPIKNIIINDKFIASKEHYGYLKDRELSLEEILKYPFVLLSNITNNRKVFDKFVQEKNINFKPTYEFNSYSLCKELIKDGFGIGIGNPIYYNDDDNFIILKTDFELPHRSFEIGYIKTSKNELLKDFIDLI